MYIGVLVVPEEEGECKHGQVVICPLETSEASQDDHRQEEFLYVLDHTNELII